MNACSKAVFVAAIAIATAVRAERLPLRAYNTADGLAHNHINRIRQDSRGFLWICTDEGLSRFDGYRFTNYTAADGVPHQYVNDLLETRRGVYWIATDGGVCRLNPGHGTRPMFTVYRPGEREESRHVNSLAEDIDGAILCATSDGLFRLEQAGGEVRLRYVEIGLPRERQNDPLVNVIRFDRQGTLWVGAGSGLFRRNRAGHWERYTKEQGLPDNFIDTLLEDRKGRLWAGTRIGGFCRLVADPRPDAKIVEQVYSVADGLPEKDVRAMFQSSDDKIWIGTSGGLTEFNEAASRAEKRFRTYNDSHGLSESAVCQLAEDRNRNLWIGTYRSGVMKLARDGPISYGRADGFRPGGFNALFANRAGEPCVASGTRAENRTVQCFDGKTFRSARLNRAILWPRITLQDRTGEWWVPSGRDLLRFPPSVGLEAVISRPPKAIYRPSETLLAGDIDALFEDARGNLWIGSGAIGTAAVTRWERSTGRFHTFSELAALPPAKGGVPTLFLEDAAGAIWIGFSDKGGLVRYRGGHFNAFTAVEGLPPGAVSALHLDVRRRLWIATSRGGVAWIEDTAADRPRFSVYTTADGLSSNETWCVSEDHAGRIYIGTNRGVDRLNPRAVSADGRWKHYTSAEGLTGGAILAALTDRRGSLWFAGNQGLSRLAPAQDADDSGPPVVISGLRVAGVPYPVSALGETRLEGLEFAPDRNHLQIDFVGLDFSAASKLRYQFRLEGGDRDWSAPVEQLTVNYASLRPGSYRFYVRSLNMDGRAGEPASLAITVRKPLWLRGWVLALAALSILFLTQQAYRFRVARLIELERVRTRIATDLHDEIGAGLSRVAVLSEVVRRQAGGANADWGQMLSNIAETSRTMIDAMSDIVWSIDPRQDDLLSLVTRVRQFASDILETQGIACTFRMPRQFENRRLAPDPRRHLYLILKEAITNAARHASCTSVCLTLTAVGSQVLVEIQDNGHGFPLETANPPQGRMGGNGLANMRTRTAALGGEFSILSRPDVGTQIILRFPLQNILA